MRRMIAAVSSRWRGIISVVAALAIANLALVLNSADSLNEVLIGGPAYRTVVGTFGVLIVLFAVRWMASLRDVGIRASTRTLIPWGITGLLAGPLAFIALTSRADLVRTTEVVALFAGLVMALFIMAWLAYSASATGKTAAVILYLAFYALLPGCAPPPPPPDPPSLQQVTFDPATVVPADRAFMFGGESCDMELRKFRVNGDWRDAVLVSPQNFFGSTVSCEDGATLVFSVASEGGGSPPAVVAYSVQGGESRQLWASEPHEIRPDKWTEVSVPLHHSGTLQVVFEAGAGECPVAVANPRVINPDTDRRPNVVLIVADALRSDHLGIYGYTRPTSREIDSLAGHGVVFENCVAQAPWTLPSVGTLLTALYPSAHGMTATDKALSPSLSTLPEQFLHAGYFTCCFQTNPLLAPQIGVAKGFARYVEFPPDDASLRAKQFQRAPDVIGAALSQLDILSSEPFFMYLHFMDTHAPFSPPAEFHSFGGGPIDRYDGEIASFSADFAGLMRAFEGRNLLDNTIVVLTADHGEQFLEHGSNSHGNCLKTEELSVPLIFWAPNTEPRRIPQLVASIDLPPTLLDLASLPPMEFSQGHSLAAALSGGELDKRNVYSELDTLYPRGQFLAALTTPTHRLIVYNCGQGAAEKVKLFDLLNDRLEYTNIASRESSLLADLKTRVSHFIQAQRSLHAQLVPMETVAPLTEERRRQLIALGYLMPTPQTQRRDN